MTLFSPDSTVAQISPILEAMRAAEIEKFHTSEALTSKRVAIALDGNLKPVTMPVALSAWPDTVGIVSTDPWLLATWQAIALNRNLPDGWDGLSAAAPRRERLDAAESLSLLFSASPVRKRPQFALDSEGNPSFAINDDNLYLHLTVEDGDKISWYAVKDGVEYFEDEVSIDGLVLPAKLKEIL